MQTPITEWNNPIPGNAGNGLESTGAFPSLATIMNPSNESFQNNKIENQNGLSQPPIPQFQDRNFAGNQQEFNNVLVF